MNTMTLKKLQLLIVAFYTTTIPTIYKIALQPTNMLHTTHNKVTPMIAHAMAYEL